MTIIHQSDFTGADGTDIKDLTPTVGTALTRLNGAKTCVVKDNRMYANTDFAYYSAAGNVPPAYPYSLSARVRQITSGPDNGAGIMAKGSGGNVTWSLRDAYVGLYINGSLYDRYFFTFSAGTDVDIELIVNSATSVTVKSHGVARFSNVAVSLGTIQAPQVFHEPGSVSATTGKHTDYFIIDDLASVAGGGKARSMLIAGVAERLADDEREDALRRMLGMFVSTGVLSYQEEARPRTRMFGYAVRMQQELEDAERRALGTLRLRTAPKPQYIPPAPPKWAPHVLICGMESRYADMLRDAARGVQSRFMHSAGTPPGGPPLTPGNGKIQFYYRKKRNR